MNIHSNNTQANGQLNDSKLDAVTGGHQKFHYVEMNGSTYAVGHINGSTVMVKVS